MLIQTGSVKIGQAERISRKMGRNPVQNHSDPVLMHIIHKIHKILWCSKARGRGIISGYLVSPGSVQRVFHDRHQLNMRIPHLLHIIGKQRRNLSVITELIRFIFRPSPGAQMNLIDAHRRLLPVRLLPVLHPRRILPFIRTQITDYGSISRTLLRLVAIRIRFQNGKRAVDFQLILIQLSRLKLRNKQLEYSRIPKPSHTVAPPVPKVEVADNADSVRIRRPYREQHSLHSSDLHRMRSKLLIDGIMLSFMESDLILFGNNRTKRVRIVKFRN